MRIFVGADHRGFESKQSLVEYLKQQKFDVEDDGDSKLEPEDDFPQFASRVAVKLLGSNDPEARGILLCGSGQGMCIAANRYKGIRATLGYSEKVAKLSRNDDDSNILCLPADDLKTGEMEKIVDTWLRTPFAGASRFVRRNQELDDLG